MNVIKKYSKIKPWNNLKYLKVKLEEEDPVKETKKGWLEK